MYNGLVRDTKAMTVLPDLLEPGLIVVFCGTAVGSISAQVGAYYAGPGNQFWEVLAQTGLTPCKVKPHEFRTLLKYGIGLTDLAKIRSGSDKAISPSDFDVPDFCSKIRGFCPKVIAFNGKKAAKAFFGCSVDYGGPKRDERIGNTAIFVLPSTAGAARGYWDKSYWRKLADFISKLQRPHQP
jgi:TDG/mug DNA glycosylase family protein